MFIGWPPARNRTYPVYSDSGRGTGLHVKSVSFTIDIHDLPTSFHFAPESLPILGLGLRSGVGRIQGRHWAVIDSLSGRHRVGYLADTGIPLETPSRKRKSYRTFIDKYWKSYRGDGVTFLHGFFGIAAVIVEIATHDTPSG